MLILIPIVLIVLALLTLGMILARKFRQLTLLDIKSLPEVKVSEKKDEFLRKRASQQAEKVHKNVVSWLRPLVKPVKFAQLNFRKYIGQVERKVMEATERKRRKEVREMTPQAEQELRTLVNEAAYAYEAGDYESAEKKYIAAIKVDEKNIEAYRGLAHVYYKQDQLEEAKQTYRFVLYLHAGDEAALLRLAEIAEEEGKLETAVDYYQQAVLLNDNISARFAKLYELLAQLGQYDTALEAIQQAIMLEPQNPKYLDNFIEASIMVGDKNLAEEGYQQLRMVNPENQKLPSFRERIETMVK